MRTKILVAVFCLLVSVSFLCVFEKLERTQEEISIVQNEINLMENELQALKNQLNLMENELRVIKNEISLMEAELRNTKLEFKNLTEAQKETIKSLDKALANLEYKWAKYKIMILPMDLIELQYITDLPEGTYIVVAYNPVTETFYPLKLIQGNELLPEED